MPIVLSNLLFMLRLGTPVGLGRGMALLIVPNHLHMWLRLGRAWSWASTRGGSRLRADWSALPIVPSTLLMGLRLGKLGEWDRVLQLLHVLHVQGCLNMLGWWS